MSEELKMAQEMIDFIYESPSAFHAVENVKMMLESCGFEELKEEAKWNVKKGGKYFTTKNESSLTAFIAGTGEVEEEGFRLVGAHTDSPSFRVKPNPEITTEGVYVKLNTEVYGGPILSTWMDRPLSLAGRVTLKSQNPMEPVIKLVDIKKPILIIPNLAIHMNREINNGVALNKQVDMLPLLSLVNDKLEKNNYLLNTIADELKVDAKSIIDFDLFLYEFEKGCIMGLNDEFISCGKLDDLSMVHAGIKALCEAEAGKATKVMVCFDNEEVGSSTKQGADSPMLSNLLERICTCMGKGREEFFRALAKSFIISCDSAHAVHPNRGEKADPVNRPKVNEGPVIKISASQSYTSDSVSIAIFQQVCDAAKVPVQRFVNRSDERGGSTIGPINSTHLNIKSVDIGTPLLAMHSVREFGGVKDQYFTYLSFKEFYK